MAVFSKAMTSVGSMQRAVARLALEDFFEVIVVPAGLPQTKPRALNYALQFCRGELLTIYDAEDIPEPDQLEKAARRFAEAGTPAQRADFTRFLGEHDSWIGDFALFMSLCEARDWRDWCEWEPALARREPAALASTTADTSADLLQGIFIVGTPLRYRFIVYRSEHSGCGSYCSYPPSKTNY